VYMGDVHFQDKVENNQGVVMGHVYSTATDGVRITGSSTSVWNGESPHFDRMLTKSKEHISRHKTE
jgi:hypothetical protein